MKMRRKIKDSSISQREVGSAASAKITTLKEERHVSDAKNQNQMKITKVNQSTWLLNLPDKRKPGNLSKTMILKPIKMDMSTPKTTE